MKRLFKIVDNTYKPTNEEIKRLIHEQLEDRNITAEEKFQLIKICEKKMFWLKNSQRISRASTLI